MSVSSTLTVNAVWQPIFVVTSTGYIEMMIQENFVGGRQAIAELNGYTDDSGNFVTTLVDCRGFTLFDEKLPGSFSLDGTIIYNLRLVSNIFEISTVSGSYSVTFTSISASQQLIAGPQGAQGTRGAQGPIGTTGAQGPQGIPGIVQATGFITYSSSVPINTNLTYLLPSGSTVTESEAQRILGTPSGGNILSLSVNLGQTLPAGDTRTITVRINGVDSAATVTIPQLVATGQWTGSVAYTPFDLISISNTGTSPVPPGIARLVLVAMTISI